MMSAQRIIELLQPILWLAELFLGRRHFPEVKPNEVSYFKTANGFKAVLGEVALVAEYPDPTSFVAEVYARPSFARGPRTLIARGDITLSLFLDLVRTLSERDEQENYGTGPRQHPYPREDD